MKVEGNKVLLTTDEYRNLRLHLEANIWHDFAKLKPLDRDLWEWNGAPCVACFETVYLYVEGSTAINEVVERIRLLSEK